MPDLLLELFCEEIPARMQKKAASDLRQLLTGALVDSGLTYEGAKEYWTPRRLTLDVRGVSARSADIKEERKGPRTDAPEKAIAGFLRGAGLETIDQAEVRSDPKKGDFYVAVIEKPGQAAQEIIASLMPGIIQNFPWPKSMRWGESSRDPGSLKWVRPLQSILCTFGPETEEPEVVEFEVGGVKAGNVTRGHRFHAPAPIKVRRFDDYVASLEKARVVLDAERRMEIIEADARNLAFAQGLELVEDRALLAETANLVEWPVVLMGEFGADYLDIPDEVIRLTIKENQKCFVLRKGDALTNRFLLVANIEASDGGAEIARGNAKVVNARLSDAKFFWETDLAVVRNDRFEPWLKKLDNVTFHAKLGSQGERVKRIAALAEGLAPAVGADPVKARRAAEICKADLSSQMVYEFPELQGLMGRRYAERAGVDASVAAACEEHYSPLGPSDDVPTDPVSVTVALADKLELLSGFWGMRELPSGSKDPYALRRAALGVIRLVLSNKLKLSLTQSFLSSLRLQLHYGASRLEEWESVTPESSYEAILEQFGGLSDAPSTKWERIVARSLLSFFHDRLKVYLRESGARHDLIDAVLSQGAEKAPGADAPPPRSEGEAGSVSAKNDDLLAIVRRVEALGSFLETENGKNLLAGTKRAANILAAEEKKGTVVAGLVDPSLFETKDEHALFDALAEAEASAAAAIADEDYAAAMTRLSALRAPVDAFFDNVMVNADDEKIRANRLALMRRIRDATGTVADFSKIAG